MQFCLRWEQEDEGRELLDITVEVIKNSMKGVIEYLDFTFETGTDYQDGWLPTLDTNLIVGDGNIVTYKYFEKPTTTNTTIRSTTAMAENPKVQSLSNDLVRRLLNTREQLPPKFKAEVVGRNMKKRRMFGNGGRRTTSFLMVSSGGFWSTKGHISASHMSLCPMRSVSGMMARCFV